MPRSGSSSRAIGYRQSRTARRLQRAAIISIVLGCLLAATTGVVLAEGAGSAGSRALGSAAAIGVESAEAQTVACKITVPPQALTARGLATPWVITEGTTPAVDPVPPKLPAGAVVEISVGFNGDELTLTDANDGQDIADSHCVNGEPGSIFGQEIFCNAPAFYAAANGNVTLTPPGTSPDDGRPCPTTESWEIVD